MAELQVSTIGQIQGFRDGHLVIDYDTTWGMWPQRIIQDALRVTNQLDVPVRFKLFGIDIGVSGDVEIEDFYNAYASLFTFYFS